jgi:hypothetical protein
MVLSKPAVAWRAKIFAKIEWKDTSKDTNRTLSKKAQKMKLQKIRFDHLGAFRRKKKKKAESRESLTHRTGREAWYLSVSTE